MKRSQFLASLLALSVIPVIPGLTVSEIVESKQEYLAFYTSFMNEDGSNNGVTGILPVKKVTHWMRENSGIYIAEIHYKNDTFKRPTPHQLCVNKYENGFYVVSVDNAEDGVCRLTLHAINSHHKNWNVKKNTFDARIGRFTTTI